MSTTGRKLTGMGLLVAGILIGATGAKALDALTPSYLDTGIFTVQPGEAGRFYASLHDITGSASATVLLQILDHAGALIVQKKVTLAAGKSTSIAVNVPGKYRAHARILDAPRVFGAERRVLGTMEVGNDLGLTIRPVCTMHEPDVQGKG